MTKIRANDFKYHFVFSRRVFGVGVCIACLLLLIEVVQAKPVWAGSPVLQDPTANPSTSIALGAQQPVVLSLTFSDSDPGDTHYVTINWDDGTSCIAHEVATDTTVAEYCSIDNETDTIGASHLYTAIGVYGPSISVVTKSPGTGMKGEQYRYVVVYDDTKGHVKGSGGFDFVHQYKPNSTSYGPAGFGFAVGYNSDSTSNNFLSNSRMRFVLYNDDLSPRFAFSSSSFDWLVISGPNALVSGKGFINGDTTTPYIFVLSIIDGALQSPPSTSDRFRIRITSVDNTSYYAGPLYYDNEYAPNPPAPTQDIMLYDPTTIVSGPIVIANAPGAASLNGTEVILVGNAPEAVVENIGQSRFLFIPFAID